MTYLFTPHGNFTALDQLLELIRDGDSLVSHDLDRVILIDVSPAWNKIKFEYNNETSSYLITSP